MFISKALGSHISRVLLIFFHLFAPPPLSENPGSAPMGQCASNVIGSQQVGVFTLLLAH